MATMVDFISSEAVGTVNEVEPEIEYPVSLAYTAEPALRLVGKVKVMGCGRRDFALSDQEWQGLGMPDGLEDALEEETEDVADVASAK